MENSQEKPLEAVVTEDVFYGLGRPMTEDEMEFFYNEGKPLCQL